MAKPLMIEANHWFDERCARAFWDQHHAGPYQELLRDTIAWTEPQPGEEWLDLGCGGGQLARALWKESRGTLRQITAVDCAAINAQAIEHLADTVEPRSLPGQITFRQADLSAGLDVFPDASVDGVVSGLALSYAESRDPVTGAYTRDAYERIFMEIFRVLRPGGRLVFSVNVPEPKFWKIARRSWKRRNWRREPFGVLLNAWRMLRYGGWLKREARKGRFHYLQAEDVIAMLHRFGFEEIEHRQSYARQADIFRAVVPFKSPTGHPDASSRTVTSCR